jgi:hypothetical protein
MDYMSALLAPGRELTAWSRSVQDAAPRGGPARWGAWRRRVIRNGLPVGHPAFRGAGGRRCGIASSASYLLNAAVGHFLRNGEHRARSYDDSDTRVVRSAPRGSDGANGAGGDRMRGE